MSFINESNKSNKYKYIYIKCIPPYKLWNDVEVYEIKLNECKKILKNEYVSTIYKISKNIKYLKINYPFDKIMNMKEIIPIDEQPILDDELYTIELFMNEPNNPRLVFPI